MTYKIDILQMELDHHLPYWLSPAAKQSELADQIRAKHRAKYLAERKKSFATRFDENQPRDESGRWTDGGGSDGGGGGDAGAGERTHPGEGYSKNSYVDAAGVIHTNNVHDAARALGENRKVELHQIKQVSTLLKELGQVAKHMEQMGKEAPVFNLCNVSVEGTNLFCAESKGIPRVEMPQMTDEQTKDFIKHLKKEGYDVEKGKEHAANLRATQNELNGAKVAATIEKMRRDPERRNRSLVISRDDYILDGHHHWAANVGIDAADGVLNDDKKLHIVRVDIPIIKLLEEAEKFTGGAGHKPASEKRLDQRRQENKAMPIKPHKDESQTDFMSRCVPEMIGTGPDKRPQEQAVAACLNVWRERDKGGGVKQAVDDVEPPDDDESYNEFMDRCVGELSDGGMDEDDAEDQCMLIWEQRGAKGAPKCLTKTHTADVDGMEFVLSDETPDRMGDIVSANGWDLQNFKSNPVALFNHRPDFVIGKWSNLRTEKNALRGHLSLAPPGTSRRIDEIRRLVDAKILKAVSVGFRPIEWQQRRNESGGYEGEHFTRQELVETSLVAVPANPNALAVAKSLKISTETLDLVFAKHGYRGDVGRRGGSTGKHAATSPKRKDRAMSTLAQRIQEVEKQLVATRDELTTHLGTVDDSNVSDAQLQKTNDLNARIAQLAKLHASLVESEKSLAESTKDNGAGAEHRALTVIETRGNEQRRDESTAVAAPAIRRKTNGKNPDPLDYIVRAQAIIIYQKLFPKLPDRIAKELEDPVTKAVHSWITRASTDPPAMTSVAGWAQELVQQIYTDFMALLIPKSIFVRLSAMGLSLSFGRAGKVVIPTRSRTPTIAGSFVGEGNPIPVRQGAFTSQTLTPKKMAVITTWTRELDEHSLPAIEGLLRQSVQEDTGVALDSVLIDSNAATTTRPAGLLNGVAALTQTAGGGLAAFDGDLKQLTNAVITGTYGNLRAPAWLMNEADINSAKLLSAPNTGIYPHKAELQAGQLLGYPVIPSVTIPTKRMIFTDAADFVSVTEGGPRFDISDQATLHMEDTNPLALATPGTPATFASPQRSLFQTDSLALRLVQPMNWLQRRAGTIAWVDNATWA